MNHLLKFTYLTLIWAQHCIVQMIIMHQTMLWLIVLLVIQATVVSGQAYLFGMEKPSGRVFECTPFFWYFCLCPKGYRISNWMCYLTCADRQVLIKGVCTRVSDQCTNWVPWDGVCVNCLEGFPLVDGKCGKECAKGQYVVNNVCTPLPQNCIKWSKGVCTGCTEGFPLKDGKCGAECGKNQFALKGVCTPVPEGCSTWERTGGCTACKNYSKYALYEGICSERCGRDEYLRDGICIPIHDKCIVWWPITGGCTSCERGYKVHDRSCIPQ